MSEYWHTLLDAMVFCLPPIRVGYPPPGCLVIYNPSQADPVSGRSFTKDTALFPILLTGALFPFLTFHIQRILLSISKGKPLIRGQRSKAVLTSTHARDAVDLDVTKVTIRMKYKQ